MNKLFKPLPTLAGDHCASCGCPLGQGTEAETLTDPKLGDVLVCLSCAQLLKQPARKPAREILAVS